MQTSVICLGRAGSCQKNSDLIIFIVLTMLRASTCNVDLLLMPFLACKSPQVKSGGACHDFSFIDADSLSLQCRPFPDSHLASGTSRAVVNAVTVEHMQRLDSQAAAESALALESDPDLLRVLAVPGLEEEVRAKCLLLFPKKEKEPPAASLQRSKSI